jgi:hypothetical protein
LAIAKVEILNDKTQAGYTPKGVSCFYLSISCDFVFTHTQDANYFYQAKQKVTHKRTGGSSYVPLV